MRGLIKIKDKGCTFWQFRWDTDYMPGHGRRWAEAALRNAVEGGKSYPADDDYCLFVPRELM